VYDKVWKRVGRKGDLVYLPAAADGVERPIKIAAAPGSIRASISIEPRLAAARRSSIPMLLRRGRNPVQLEPRQLAPPQAALNIRPKPSREFASNTINVCNRVIARPTRKLNKCRHFKESVRDRSGSLFAWRSHRWEVEVTKRHDHRDAPDNS
jgi:hypothetical protein